MTTSLGIMPLAPLLAPAITSAAEPLWKGSLPTSLFDGDPRTYYAFAGRGADTYVEFDFGAVVPLAGFRRCEVDVPALDTVAASELVCFDEQGRETGRIPTEHAGRHSAISTHAISPPVPARPGAVAGHPAHARRQRQGGRG